MQTDLRLLLQSRNITLASLARDVGVDKSTVVRWAQRRVPADRVVAVEQLTGVSRHELRPDIFGPAKARRAKMAEARA